MTKRKQPEYGLLQPQSVELEEAILGACMLESEAINLVVDILTPDCFYKEANQILFMAIIDLYKRSSPIDILTVCQKLKSLDKLEDVGGAYYISSLTNRIASSSNIEYHSRIVVQQYLKREMIRLSTENIKNAYDDTLDVFDTFQKGITKIEGAISGVIKYDVKQIGKVHEKVIAESIIVAQSGIKSGVPTGFRNVDNFTNGWQKTDLIILAGRPAMGKSVCGLAFALNPAIRDNIATAVFSLEMSNDQLVGRAQSSLSGINSSRIIKKQLTVDEVLLVESRCFELNTAPIYIDDTPSLSLIDLKGKARKLVRDKKVRLIVIDYLQLMTVDAGKGNREQEVSMISKGLKALAKELDIPIIALSQLSRAVESRGGDKKPMLSDLRESGSIEQDADMVIFCYRPEYYGIETYEIGGETLECSGLMSLIVAKHRAGSLGELRLGFNGDLTKLENYDSFKSNQNSSYTKAEPTINTNTKLPENNDFLNEQKQSTETETEDDDDLPF
jgi:replicative DNA helicase